MPHPLPGGESQKQAVLPGQPRHHPFYPEGGQVGDAGTLTAPAALPFRHQEENIFIVHFVNELPADVNATLWPKSRRPAATTPSATTRRPTSTKPCAKCWVPTWSRKDPRQGRVFAFDFSHFSKVTDEELPRWRPRNAKIRQPPAGGAPRDHHGRSRASGAMMLFGEKYGDEVRMIEFDSSKELGTHALAPAHWARSASRKRRPLHRASAASKPSRVRQPFRP